MIISRRILATAAVAALTAGVMAYAAGARAQTAPAERIVGYAVHAQSHYVMTQRADGAMRACKINRQTVLNTAPRWECQSLPALP